MHNKAKYILLLLAVMLFSLPQAEAQSKFTQKLKNIFSSSKNTEETIKDAPESTFREIPRVQFKMPDIVSNMGLSLNSFLRNDIWTGMGYIPEITIPLEDAEDYQGTFDIAEYSAEAQNEMDEDEDLDYSDTPEEYNIWTNAAINPYNVKLSESMKDTVRIDISSFTSPGYKYVTSEFGGRWGRLHAGIDLKLFVGDTVRSAFDRGVVRITKYDPRGYGYYVVVRHGNGLETLYGHMSKILVEEGQNVAAGEALGLGGNTGRSTGPHLHFELRYLGNPINPRDAINFNNATALGNTLILTRDNFKYQNIKYSKSSSKRGKGRKASSKKSKKKVSRPSKTAKGKSGGKGSITVRKGDTLGALAKKHGTTVSKLKKLNGIKGTTIRAGQKLRVK